MSKAKGKSSTIFFHDWLEIFRMLKPEEVGYITMALLDLDANGTETEFGDRTLDIVYADLSRAVRRNRKDYEKTCENRAEYQRKKKEMETQDDTKVYKSIQEYTNVSDSESDSESDTDSVSDSGSGSDSDSDWYTATAPLHYYGPSDDQKVYAILEAWNSLTYVRKPIDRIPFGGRRWSNTFLCIAEVGWEEYINCIRNLDTNAYFQTWQPTYDWFCDPNNFIKVLEGNYRDKRKDPNEVDWEAL